MSNKKSFHIERVVTKDIATDFFQEIRNFFGLRQRGYEFMLKKHISELTDEMQLEFKSILWYRLIVNPLANNAVMIILYGEYNG